MKSKNLDESQKLEAWKQYSLDPRIIFARGWHPAEEWGRWASERQAKLVFRTGERGGGKVFVLLLLHIPPGSEDAVCAVRIGRLETNINQLTRRSKWHLVEGEVSSDGVAEVILISRGPFGRPDGRDLYVGFHSLIYCRSKKLQAHMHLLIRRLLLPLAQIESLTRGITSSTKRGTGKEVGSSTSQVPIVQHVPSLNSRLLQLRTSITELLTEFDQNNGTSSRHLSHDYDRHIEQIRNARESVTAVIHNVNAGVNRISDHRLNMSGRLVIVFDVSDLIQYFGNHRLPTGIQRVQMEVISVALLKSDPAVDIQLCCFMEADDYWRQLPAADFVTLCELSLISNDWTASDWRGAMADVISTLRGSSNFVFPKGAYLVNIGTSWWLQSYFLHVREAKIKASIRYVPFVHDMIPIVTPEHCVVGLVQDFIGWAVGVFLHADYFFVNSESTRSDLKIVARKLGFDVADTHIHTVRLDADYRSGQSELAPLDTLQTHRLTPKRYVLFVSTIESRKNHLTAFDAWHRLLKKYGPRETPKLVCVGHRGWLNDPVFAKLGSNSDLRNAVVMLSGVPDAELAALYQNCLFTIYPSYYEGWGLPVTESLCYGKVPVLARSSSLPEAGGEFAEYFDLSSPDQLDEIIERLIVDNEYRESREALISQKYRPRDWAEVSGEIVTTLADWSESNLPDRLKMDDIIFPPIALGRYYPISRVTESKLTPSMRSGEIFRAGTGWWGCEDWGCWLKTGPARMTMQIAGGGGRHRLYLGLRGVTNKDTSFDVTILGYESIRGLVATGKIKWVVIDFDIKVATPVKIEIVMQGYETGYERPRDDMEEMTVALGVIGFMICKSNDIETRSNFVEAVALDSLDLLSRDTHIPN